MSTSIRALIVDDEPLARRGIRARLALAPDFEIVCECATGRTAIDAVHSLAPDLVFLDVQMPEVDGFAVIDAVGAECMPIVIFVTAYDTFALKAFETHAVDYLLKPIDDARFAESLGRVRARMHDSATRTHVHRLEAILDEMKRDSAHRLDRIAVRDRGRMTLLDPREIEWVAADGDYVRIIVGARRYLVRETLTAMAARLPALRFERIHRSTIINVEHIRDLTPMPNREFVVALRDGTRLRSSRSYEERIRRVLATML